MTLIDVPIDRELDVPETSLADAPARAEPADGGSPFSRVIVAFLQPGNIKWLLVAGVLILLASSLMLVGAHWHSYAPAWKYLILLGYAGGVGVVGSVCVRRLMLPRTGGVLMALAVLLMPVAFLGLSLVGRTGPPIVFLALFALNAAVALFTARSAFRYFLRGDQPTFLAAYLLLSSAGAFLVTDAMSPLAAAGTTLLYWIVFAAGAVKVNRHCFWLVEERRLPRVLGFVPILLLGAQFLTLFLLGPAGHLPLAWMGFGLVLVAAVLLATADGVARVFQQRTGDLVRPIPWPIVAPIVLGVVFTLAGLILSGVTDVLPYRPYALVPTAVVATVLMSFAARRTGVRAFVWAALFIAAVAYNFSPVFFVDVARAVVSQGAAAVSENRLPLPFYGLTYLPLLAGLLVVGGIARRRGGELLLVPVRQFTFGLATLLLAASFGHPKATLPVAAAMTAFFAAHAAVFSDRRSAWASAAAFVVTAGGLPGFARGVLGIDLPPVAAEMITVAAAAVTLLVLSRPIDGLVQRLVYPSNWARFSPITAMPARYGSAAVSLALAGVWLATGSLVPATPAVGVAGLMVALLLIVHSIVWVRVELSFAAVLFAQVAAVRLAVALGASVGEMISVATAVVLAQAIVATVMRRFLPTARVTTALEPAFRQIARVEMFILLLGIHLPAAWLSAFPERDLLLVAVAFAFVAAGEFRAACREQRETRVWSGLLMLAAAVAYFIAQGVIPIGRGFSLYVPMIAAVLFQAVAMTSRKFPSLAVLDRPFRRTALALPAATVGLAVARHLAGEPTMWLGARSLALLLAAGFYFWRGMERRDARMHVLSAFIVNIAMALLWRELRLTDPQFYLVPLGASVLLLVQVLRREIPAAYRDRLRYAGALLILISPTFHIVGGSWVHLLSLMVLSLVVMIAGIGLRLRALLYAGAAFLAADLVTIVVRGGIDRPNLLWLAGLGVGAAVIALAAIAERHREHLLQRLRTLSATLATWQ